MVICTLLIVFIIILYIQFNSVVIVKHSRVSGAVLNINKFPRKSSDIVRMTSLISDYEQQYAVLTAEITAAIGTLSRTSQGCLFSSILKPKIYK